MNLLLFSDLHNDRDAARALVKRARAADVVVGAGDFSNAHAGLSGCVGIFRKLTRPLVLVAGNNETAEELQAEVADWPAAHVLHGTAAEAGGVTFFGVGGGIPVTPFGSWSYDFDESQAAELLAPCPPGCVLVVHSPPLGCVDLSGGGRHLGSVAIRDAILRVRPRLVVCGHIHGSAGQTADLDGTPVVNAGPAGVEFALRT